ncbi:putative tricarboxylic transport membrane protein [Fusobacterium sp. PH5-44]
MLFSLYCFFLVGAQSPAATATELGAAFWPRIILFLMIILLGVNIKNNLSKKKSEKDSEEKFNIMSFFKSKLLVGMLIIIAMALVYPKIGFIPVCLVFLISYGYLLGEKNIGKLFIISLIITIVLYIVFQGGLNIRLERGVGQFRRFALSLENIILSAKRGLR